MKFRRKCAHFTATFLFLHACKRSFDNISAVFTQKIRRSTTENVHCPGPGVWGGACLRPRVTSHLGDLRVAIGEAHPVFMTQLVWSVRGFLCVLFLLRESDGAYRRRDEHYSTNSLSNCHQRVVYINTGALGLNTVKYQASSTAIFIF